MELVVGSESEAGLEVEIAARAGKEVVAAVTTMVVVMAAKVAAKVVASVASDQVVVGKVGMDSEGVHEVPEVMVTEPSGRCVVLPAMVKEEKLPSSVQHPP